MGFYSSILGSFDANSTLCVIMTFGHSKWTTFENSFIFKTLPNLDNAVPCVTK